METSTNCQFSGASARVDGQAGLAKYTISWLYSSGEIPGELWDRCFRPPLEGRWWYSTLEKSGLEDQFEFAYALVLADGQPIAIAPTFFMKVPMELVAPEFVAIVLKVLGKLLPGVDYQPTLFVGSPCADEGSVGLVPGARLDDFLPVLQEALARRAAQLKAVMIAWKDFGQSDCPSLDLLSSRFAYFKIPSYPGTILELPAGDFEDYLKSLQGPKRYKLRKKLKRSKALGAFSTEIVQNPDGKTLAEIFDLFWQTYEHGKTKFERLTPEFFRLIAQPDSSYFVLLRKPDGKLAAFMLCFKLGARVINKFIGLDYSLGGDWYIYFRLWESAVKWVMSCGVSELQSGQTGYRAKLDVGHRLIPLTNYCRHLNPVINTIYALVSRTISWSTLDPDLAEFQKAHPD